MLQIRDISNLLSNQLDQKPLTHLGVHYILELYDCSPELLNDRAFITGALRQAAKIAQSTLLGLAESSD